MKDAPALWEKMRALAEVRNDLPADWLEKAQALEYAAKGFFAEPQTVTAPKFLGCFARARRMWCNATGESLI
jgi:hypothetical protein